MNYSYPELGLIMTRKTKQTFLLLLRILGTIIGIVLGAVSCTLWF